jgi:hypothetical protein
MARNADGTRLPYRMHCEYLHKLLLDNALARGQARLGDGAQRGAKPRGHLLRVTGAQIVGNERFHRSSPSVWRSRLVALHAGNVFRA